MLLACRHGILNLLWKGGRAPSCPDVDIRRIAFCGHEMRIRPGGPMASTGKTLTQGAFIKHDGE